MLNDSLKRKQNEIDNLMKRLRNAEHNKGNNNDNIMEYKNLIA